MRTDKDFKTLEHISDETIRDDIMDTMTEIEDYESELEILKKRPQENKVSIYMIEGKILNRKDFIEELEDILLYRIITEATNGN